MNHQDYIWNYVGHSSDGYSQILLQQAQSILGGKNNTLQYFVPWIENGHRSANFLRLWSLPEDESETGSSSKAMSLRLFSVSSSKVFAATSWASLFLLWTQRLVTSFSEQTNEGIRQNTLCPESRRCGIGARPRNYIRPPWPTANYLPRDTGALAEWLRAPCYEQPRRWVRPWSRISGVFFFP